MSRFRVLRDRVLDSGPMRLSPVSSDGLGCDRHHIYVVSTKNGVKVPMD